MGGFQVIIESVLYVITSQQLLICSPEARQCPPYMIISAPENFYPQPLFFEPSNIHKSTTLQRKY